MPNPSFEQNTGCPQGYDEMYFCNDWYKPTQGSSDYFHSCAPDTVVTVGVVNVPENSDGYQYAQDGDAYVGFIAYVLQGGSDYNEYIQCQLLQPLVAGKKYKVKFYVSLADSFSNHAIKNLGAWLSDTAYIDMSNFNTIPANPQVVANYFLADFNNWMEVNGTFIANGGEEYLTIGTFVSPVLNTDTLFVQNTLAPVPYAYCYVDMVSLIEVGDLSCLDSLSLPNVFTPNNDGVNDEFIISANCETEINITVYNRWGVEIYHTTGVGVVSWKGGNYNDGVYYYVISYINQNKEKIIKKGFVQLLR